jgi:hypothetical protein
MTALELKTINENLKTDNISDELKEKIDELKKLLKPGMATPNPYQT